MPLVPVKCTNCGAPLIVDSAKDASICQYCHSAFVVEQAIRNYNINASVVNIYGGNSVDFIIRAGTLEKYNNASPDVVIPDSVTIIGDEAFKDCSGLKSVTVPSSVKTIGNSAFMGCSGLEKVIISNGLVNIGNSAFNGCSGLKNITIPESVVNIGHSAFFGCMSLTDITIPQNVQTIGGSAFKNCKGLTNVVFFNTVATVGFQIFEGCSNILDMNAPTDDMINITAPIQFKSRVWRSYGRCELCGGEISNLFRRCKQCGTKNRY